MTRTNLFLIGAAKAGTTALAEMLGNHPLISTLAIKEPGHFCDDIYAEGFSAGYQIMLRWDEAQFFNADALDQRHMAFVRGRENYNRLVSEASEAQYILDASTAYLPSVNAAENIASYNSEAKIIVSLRNPATRAYSHYNMARKYGKEQRSFLDAIKAEGALEKARWGWEECFWNWVITRRNWSAGSSTSQWIKFMWFGRTNCWQSQQRPFKAYRSFWA